MPPRPDRFSRQFLTEEEKAARPRVTGALLKRILSYIAPYWKQTLVAVCAVFVSSLFTLLPSILTGRIVDEGLIGKNIRALVFLTIVSLLVTLGANLIGVFQTWVNAWISQHIIFDIRNKMYSHLQKMPQGFFTASNQGDIITRMTSDISGVQGIFTDTFSRILSMSLTLAIALFAMFQKNWRLALLGIAIVPLFVIPSRLTGKRRFDLTQEAQGCADEMNGILNETLSVSGQLLVKLFCAEGREYERYQKVNRRMTDLSIKENMAGRWFFMAMTTFSSIGPMLLYLVGGILMMKADGSITVGDITVFVALLGKIYMPVNELLNIHVDWIRSMALFSRIFEYFDMKVQIENPPDAIVPSSCKGQVEFKGVSFSYSPERQILKDVSFSLAEGKCLAIVGPSGSGKSTIVNLIPRLYDADSGSVLFDGVDVRKLDLNFLRSRIGIVSQETYLFNGTIRENLLYAKPDAAESELVEACKTANIWDFISAQEKGLDTFVGNRGLKLSGGEKQRVSIARVLLKNPALIIFDEATSALDSIGERKIQDAIEPIVKSRASILIAHRLSTILAADEILVVKDGRVVERGSHSSLVGAGGVYTELYETQFKRKD